jgi:uncharacterized protein (DUF433 family)
LESYTPAQAAAVTGLPLAAVHKAIDSRLIRPRSARSGATVRRLLTREQLIYLQLEAEGLRLLPVGTRRQIAEFIQRSPNTDVLAVGNGTALFVEFKTARRKIEGQLKQLAHIEEMVSSDPEIMGGTPVFKGTRVPVDLVADMLAGGATTEEILDGYPTLDREKVSIAPLYMRAFPRRGRRTRRPWPGKTPHRQDSFPLATLLKSA